MSKCFRYTLKRVSLYSQKSFAINAFISLYFHFGTKIRRISIRSNYFNVILHHYILVKAVCAHTAQRQGGRLSISTSRLPLRMLTGGRKKNKKSIRDTVFMAFWLARPALSSYRYARNVRIFSLQPSLRIDFFETKRLLTEKNAFLKQVGKRLSIRTIPPYQLSGVFLSGSRNCHPYRIGTAILIGQAVSFLRDGTACPIGMSLSFL